MNISKKTVLVTGADGFIGSHLVEGLLQQNCEVRAFVYYNSFNSWGWLDSFPPDLLRNLQVISGDIRDAQRVREAVRGADVVFHLAALIGIPYSYVAPESYVDVNIKGTLNILKAALDYSVEKLLVTSTSEVYGTARYVPIDEEHPKQGQSPYSASKIGADYISESFYKSFGLPVVLVRPFNTYGPRQSSRAVIPAIITQLLDGKNEISLGALEPTRDLVFVKDTAVGFIKIAMAEGALGEVVNISTKKEVSIEKLADILIQKINPQAKIVQDVSRLRPKKSEVERLLGDNSKLKKLTGWTPGVDIEEGLERTIQWFSDSKNMLKYKTRIYNI